MDTIEYMMKQKTLQISYRNSIVSYTELVEIINTTTNALNSTQICTHFTNNKRCQHTRQTNSNYCNKHTQQTNKKPCSIQGTLITPTFIKNVIINNQQYQIDSNHFIFQHNKCIGMYNPQQEPQYEFFNYIPDYEPDFNPLFD